MPLIPLDQIHVGERLRQLDPKNLELIKSTARKFGILAPIFIEPQTVLIDGVEKYPVEDGAHRYEVARQLGYTEIKCDFSDNTDPRARRIREFLHNYARKDFDPAQKDEIIHKLHFEMCEDDPDWTQDKTAALFNLGCGPINGIPNQRIF